MRLFAGSDGPGFEGDATSAWVTALGTWDLRPQALPLVLHFNLGFYLDNSGNLQDPARFSSSMLASRSVATFAYGIGRDRLRSSVALAAPMERRVGAVALEPFVEYHFELVTDDPDPAYQAFAPPRCLSSSSNCAGNRDQHWLSFGLRTSLGGGFALLGGLDLGVRSPGYPYGSALLPFNVLFGVRQALGLAPPPPRRFTRTVTVERRVAVAARPASGQVQLEVGAPGFQPQSVSAMVTPGQTTAVQVTLEPVPAPAPASPPPAPVRIEAGRVVTSGPIGFVDEAGAEPALTAEAQATLAQLAPQLAAPSAPAHIRIEAHWDNGLPRAEAEALTRRQAEVVAAYLIERGVPRDRLQPVGLGATRPRVPNLGPTSRSKNRRVELVVGALERSAASPRGAIAPGPSGPDQRSPCGRPRATSRSRNRSGASVTWARFSSKRRRSSAIRPPAGRAAAHQRQHVLQAEAREHQRAAQRRRSRTPPAPAARRAPADPAAARAGRCGRSPRWCRRPRPPPGSRPGVTGPKA